LRLLERRAFIPGGRHLREALIAGDGTTLREATLGFNRLEGRFELATVDSFEPGLTVYAGRDAGTAAAVSLHGESAEAGMGPEPTSRKRDLRFDMAIEGPDANVQRIRVRHPGGAEYLFVEQRFTRRPQPPAPSARRGRAQHGAGDGHQAGPVLGRGAQGLAVDADEGVAAAIGCARRSPWR
jgi:hypothetical protein